MLHVSRDIAKWDSEMRDTSILEIYKQLYKTYSKDLPFLSVRILRPTNDELLKIPSIPSNISTLSSCYSFMQIGSQVIDIVGGYHNMDVGTYCRDVLGIFGNSNDRDVLDIWVYESAYDLSQCAKGRLLWERL